MHHDPIELFQAAVDALNHENWRALSALCDPASLSEFKRDLLASLSPPAPDGPKLTATELLKAVPGMPRAVAEYQVQRFRESMDPQHRLRDEVPSVKSRSALEAMSPNDVFAAWLDGRSQRRLLERNVEKRRMSRATANEVIADGTRRFKYQPLGFVDDGEAIRYIVYRCSPNDTRPTTAMTRRQSDGSWLLVAGNDFLMVNQAQLMATDDEEETSMSS